MVNDCIYRKAFYLALADKFYLPKRATKCEDFDAVEAAIEKYVAKVLDEEQKRSK